MTAIAQMPLRCVFCADPELFGPLHGAPAGLAALRYGRMPPFGSSLGMSSTDENCAWMSAQRD
jgi:hypothetical protein